MIVDLSVNSWVEVFLLVGAAIATVYVALAPSKRQRLPPGPRRSFWSAKGLASSLPPWKQFAALHKEYGPVVSFYQGKTPVVVLGTIKAAIDLLDKKGKIYSSRPRKIVAGEILSRDLRGIAMPYGQRWRNWRSLMHAGMGLEASYGYKDFQSMEAKILLRDLLTEKDMTRYPLHLRRFAVSIVVCVSYGRRIESLDDPIVLAHQSTEESYTRCLGTQYLVDSWPILLKLPRFLQWFRPAAERQRKIDTELYVSLMEEVRRQLALGHVHHSTAKRGLEKQTDFGLDDVELAYSLSAPFVAGVGTTLSAIDVFILLMLRYPETMKKAQAEIDAVFLSSSMSRIEEMFPSPDEFKPERYLETEGASNGPTPHPTFFFGFGRRICPGMHVANNSLFIVITSILWAFNINPPLDDKKQPIIPPADDFVGILVSRPRPFSYIMEFRRDSASRSLVMDECKRAEEEGSRWM